MNGSTPGFPIFHYLPKFAQTRAHWFHNAIQLSHPLFLSSASAFNLPVSGSSPVSQLFASGGQSIGASASTSVLPMNIQGWFPLGLIDLISLLSNGLSRVFSRTTIWKHQFLGIQPSLWSICHIRTWLLEKPQLWLYGPHSTSLTWLLKVLC